MIHSTHNLTGDDFLEVRDRVHNGDRIQATYPAGDDTGTVTGTIFEIDDRIIRFSNDKGVYLLRRYGDLDYHTGPRNIRVLKDLNPNGAVHLHGLNEQGDPAAIEICNQDGAAESS